MSEDAGSATGDPHMDPVAAEEINGGRECQYEDDCDNEADWLVEGVGGGRRVSFYCCAECSRTHAIWVEENELTKTDISEELKP